MCSFHPLLEDSGRGGRRRLSELRRNAPPARQVLDRRQRAGTQEVSRDLGYLDGTLRSRGAQQRGLNRGLNRCLSEVLVDHSSYSRKDVKRRLFTEGVKERVCELCGQDEEWRGRRMGLVLDHINGVRDDHRLENLRIVCPNCNATLDTHCGRSARVHPIERECALCSRTFRPNYGAQRYCSRACGSRSSPSRGPRPGQRRVERPPYAQLVAEVSAEGWSATGRRYEVSDNAVKKWARQYEAELGTEDADALRPPSLRSRWEGGRPPMRPSDRLDGNGARHALSLLAVGRTPIEVAERLGVSKWCIYTLRRGESHRWLKRPDEREST